MVGIKESTYKTLLIGLFLISLIGCKNSPTQDDESFIFVGRNAYFEDNINGVTFLRDNETRKPLNGYYVVGNETSKWEEFNVKEGVLEGDYIIFHDNGEIFSHSQYKRGKLHGEEKINYKSGKLKTLKTFTNGTPYGITKTFFESGQLQIESKLKDGEIVESTAYNIVGEIIAQSFEKDGRTIRQSIKSGKVYKEEISSNYDNFEAVKFFDDEGKMTMFIRMYEEGEDRFFIELDENENEINRVNLKKDPHQIIKYRKYFEQH
ncbi:hypothetical protein [Winogradskyella sp. 3972H.M.0a.05]|uniref:toxin-antitoxin system YwqK family antitoxin n=1 Tax=Winogradskyella sp. 3972H.M.0a.05 TaxID=2950277 RepID=UPI0033925D04